MKSTERAVWRVISPLLLIQLLTALLLYESVEKLFALDELGFETWQLVIPAAVMLTVKIVLELPTGTFADRFGRRQTLGMGLLIMMAAVAVMGLSNDFWSFTIGNGLIGAFLALRSGTIEAFAIDLVLIDRCRLELTEDEAESLAGLLMNGEIIGLALAGVGGGLIADTFGYRATYAISFAALVVAAIALLRTDDAPVLQPTEKSTMELITSSFRLIWHERSLRLVLGLSALLAMTMKPVGEYLQPYAREAGLSRVEIGALATVGMFVSVIALTRNLNKSSWRKRAKYITPSLMFLGVIGMGMLSSWLGIGSFLALAFMRYLSKKWLKGLANQKVKRSETSSNLSALEFVEQIAVVIGLGIGALLSSAFGFQTMILVFGVVGIIPVNILQQRLTKLQVAPKEVERKR
jgi:MFS family permease